MALINCSECGKEVSDKASSCPNCGNPINISDVVKESHVDKKTQSSGCFKNLVVAILIFVVGITLVNLITGESSNSTSVGVEHNKLLAFSYATDCVKNNLKSPSSAKFVGLLEKEESVKYIGDDTYEIKSWVDSQNSFGAMIRSNFRCVISFKDNKVSCVEVDIY